MTTYKVIVHEINELTYEVEADSAQEALEAYSNTDLEWNPVKVIDPEGKEIDVNSLEWYPE